MDKAGLLERIRRNLLRFDYDLVDINSVVDAMQVVDRKFFVNNRKSAYVDSAMAVAEGQTISQPSTVARMLLLADLEKGQSVLEVGVSSGWSACLTAYIVHPGKVLSIDRIGFLVEVAEKNVSDLKEELDNPAWLENLEFGEENLFDFDAGQFDRVIITAGITHSQEEKIEKLAARLLDAAGKLICPMRRGPIIIFEKGDGIVRKDKTSEEYVFVPLKED